MEYRVEPQGSFVYVFQSGRLVSEAEALEFQQAVETAAAQTQGRVLFDNRGTEAPAEELRNFMHEWVFTPTRFTRAALLFESDMLLVGINMEALAKGVGVKAFTDMDAAQQWLRR